MITLILSLFGIADSFYLVIKSSQSVSGCLGAGACNEVLTSIYSKILNVPIAVLGVGFFLSILYLSFRRKQAPSALILIRFLSMIAAQVSVLLLILQGAVIGAWCWFCVFSSLLVFAILGASFSDRLPESPDTFMHSLLKERRLLSVTAGLLILPFLIFFTINSASSFSSSRADTLVIAQIGNRKITMSEAKIGLGLRYKAIEEAFYQETQEWLNSELFRLEAEAKGVSIQKLLDSVAKKRISVTEKEVKDYFTGNGGHFPHKNWDDFKTVVERDVRRKKFQDEVKPQFLEELRKKYHFELSLPATIRIVVPENKYGSPTKGNPKATLQILNFSDFSCSFCKEAFFDGKKWIEAYPDDIQLTYRFFPMNRSRLSDAIHFAAACASEQNKFWAFGEEVFLNQGKIKGEDIPEIAAKAGLEMSEFAECINSGRGRDMVSEDIDIGIRLGVKMTPSFFLNGVYHTSTPKAAYIKDKVAELK